MKSFYMKNILMGIGIGIIIAALTGIIYSAGMNPQMSKQEIMDRAKQYGMVLSSDTIITTDQEEGNDFIDDKTDGETLLEEESIHENDKVSITSNPTENANSKEDAVKSTENAVQEVQIRVNRGDTSLVVAENLFEKGLIESIDSFENLLKEMNLESSIQVGEFVIVKGTDEASIARIICGLH